MERKNGSSSYNVPISVESIAIKMEQYLYKICCSQYGNIFIYYYFFNLNQKYDFLNDYFHFLNI